MLYVTGSFCQPKSGLGIGHDPSLGVAATVRQGVIPVFFSGFIVGPIDERDTYQGLMLDMLNGQAELSNVQIGERTLSFEKRYMRDGQPYNPDRYIEYVLEKGSDDWVGTYTIWSVSEGMIKLTGPVRCVVQEVDDETHHEDLMTYARKIEEVGYFSQHT